jgi:hypothetical protein
VLIESAVPQEQPTMIRNIFQMQWKPEDVARGSISLVDGTKKTLKECLNENFPVPKVTIIQKVGNMFSLIHETYYINENDLKDADEEEMMRNVKFKSKTDSFMALRTLLRFLMHSPDKNQTKINEIVAFMNGPIGELNKIRSELDILTILLKDSTRPLVWQDIKNNLELIQQQIAKVYNVNGEQDLFPELANLSQENAYPVIESIKDYFREKINQKTKDFLQSHI